MSLEIRMTARMYCSVIPRISKLHVNGREFPVGVEAECSLIGVLRDDLELTGSKYGCGEGQCGAQEHLLARRPGRGPGQLHRGRASGQSGGQLAWTREEEFTWAYFRPTGVIEVEAGVDRDGKCYAWEFHNFNSGGAAIATRYDVPNRLIISHNSQSPLRRTSLNISRGLPTTHMACLLSPRSIPAAWIDKDKVIIHPIGIRSSIRLLI
jgi:hypothetical protein